jgi:hypothetical protein
VTRCPSKRRGSESSLHHGSPTEWPSGGRGQPRSSHGRSRNSEQAQTNRHENAYAKLPTQYLSCSRNRALNPPTSSHSSPLGLVLASLARCDRSLAEERAPLLIPPQHSGARFPDARSKDLHDESLRMRARIVQPRGNLWMTFEGTLVLWIDSPVRICYQV